MTDRHSRCEEPHEPPLIYHLYLDRSSNESPVKAELDGLLAALPEGERAVRRGEVVQRLRAATRGLLALNEELKPIRRDPHLWEIRWHWRHSHWRAYHAEPGAFPGYLVALRFHAKELLADGRATSAAQDQEIYVAARRYREGRLDRWGIP